MQFIPKKEPSQISEANSCGCNPPCCYGLFCEGMRGNPVDIKAFHDESKYEPVKADTSLYSFVTETEGQDEPYVSELKQEEPSYEGTSHQTEQQQQAFIDMQSHENYYMPAPAYMMQQWPSPGGMVYQHQQQEGVDQQGGFDTSVNGSYEQKEVKYELVYQQPAPLIQYVTPYPQEVVYGYGPIGYAVQHPSSGDFGGEQQTNTYTEEPQQQLVQYRPRKIVRQIKKESTNIRTGQICSNCKTTKTTMWRRTEIGLPECNACNLYWRKNNRPRPASLSKKEIVKRKRNPRVDYIPADLTVHPAQLELMPAVATSKEEQL